jgi:hypothetical protein
MDICYFANVYRFKALSHFNSFRQTLAVACRTRPVLCEV